MVSNELRKILANLKVTERTLTDLVNVSPTLIILAKTEAALCLIEKYVSITLEVDMVRTPETTSTPVCTTTVTPVLCRINCRSRIG